MEFRPLGGKISARPPTMSDKDDKDDKELGEPVFVPPTVDRVALYQGVSYSYYSPCPSAILSSSSSSSSSSPSTTATPCVLGIDEAGRGPVLGPMVYSAFYLPLDLHHSLLARDYSFNDSKVLSSQTRLHLMRLLCTPGHALHDACGYAVKALSARDISSGMMRPGGVGAYNLNAQAMDATIEIIRGVVEDRGINVQEVYIDTIGNPTTYQQRLERIFPSFKITVAKKADSLYPCVSAASVVAKVTRDLALDVCYQVSAQRRKAHGSVRGSDLLPLASASGWGSGYPSDSKCVDWLRQNMDPLFGWGHECRFSWSTAKEMLELKGGVPVDWPAEGDDTACLAEFLALPEKPDKGENKLRDWYGEKAVEIF